jgi:hypothetical protein
MHECVTISACSEAVVLQTSNSSVTIPRDKLSRSPILRQAVEDCEMCRPVEMNVPAGFTEALGELLALQDQSDAIPGHRTPSSTLLLYVQVFFHV